MHMSLKHAGLSVYNIYIKQNRSRMSGNAGHGKVSK